MVEPGILHLWMLKKPRLLHQPCLLQPPAALEAALQAAAAGETHQQRTDLGRSQQQDIGGVDRQKDQKDS